MLIAWNFDTFCFIVFSFYYYFVVLFFIFIAFFVEFSGGGVAINVFYSVQYISNLFIDTPYNLLIYFATSFHFATLKYLEVRILTLCYKITIKTPKFSPVVTHNEHILTILHTVNT